jgi:hypothetical protein
MAIANRTLTFARAVVAASGTSVVATNGGSAPVPDNCHTILVTNPSTTIVLLVGMGVAPAALTAGVNAQRVPPGATLTLGVGIRGSMRGAMDESTDSGSGLIFDSIGGAVTGEITYENIVGGGGL